MKRIKKNLRPVISVFKIVVLLTFTLAVNVSAAVNFSESFDNDDYFDRGWEMSGSKSTPEISTEQFHSAPSSGAMFGESGSDGGASISYMAADEDLNKVLELWIYDDAVVEGDNASATMLAYSGNLGHIAVGIHNGVWKTRLAGDWTEIEGMEERVTGWYRVVIDFSTGNSAKIWVDDKLITEIADYEWGGDSRQIEIGNLWSSWAGKGLFIDDFSIYEGPYNPTAAEVENPAAEVPAETPDVVTDPANTPVIVNAPQTNDNTYITIAVTMMMLFASIIIFKNKKIVR